MRKIAYPLLIVLLMASVASAQGPVGSPGAASIGDSFYPNLGNGGYDVQHYMLDLAWDDQTDALSGTATIDAIATQDLSAFNLDFSGFDIEGVIVNDMAAEYDRAGSEFTILPAEVLSEGESFTVAVMYSGVPEPLAFEIDEESLGG